MVMAVRRQLTIRDVTAGGDTVIGWCPLPAGARITKVWMDVDLAGASTPFPDAVAYQMHAYVLPCLDPDTLPATPDDMWDKQVPKDAVVGTSMLDLDTGAADTGLVNEYEELQFDDMLGQSTAPDEVFKRNRIITVGSDLSAVLSATTFLPVDRFKVQMSGKKFQTVDVPSVLLFAVGSPNANALDSAWTGADAWMPDSDGQWALLGMPEVMLELAVQRGVGLVTPGTGTIAHDDALETLARFLEQTYFFAAGDIQATNWRSTARFTYMVSLPGRPKFRMTSE